MNETLEDARILDKVWAKLHDEVRTAQRAATTYRRICLMAEGGREAGRVGVLAVLKARDRRDTSARLESEARKALAAYEAAGGSKWLRR